MKLKDYSELISALAKKYPDAKVVYSCDEEGNAFSESHFSPSEGRFSKGQFMSIDDQMPPDKVNAICIN